MLTVLASWIRKQYSKMFRNQLFIKKKQNNIKVVINVGHYLIYISFMKNYKINLKKLAINAFVNFYFPSLIIKANNNDCKCKFNVYICTLLFGLVGLIPKIKEASRFVIFVSKPPL